MPDIRQVIPRYSAFIRALPDIVADVMINFVLDNFEAQSFAGESWAQRADGDTSRALLVRSGRGRRSIRISEASMKRVQVTTDLEYMVAHNDGAEITRVITPRMRRFFWAMHYRLEYNTDTQQPIIPEDQWRWKWMALKKGEITFKMPQRQFIGESPELDMRLRQAIERELEQVFN